jgi:hypothetical protein
MIYKHSVQPIPGDWLIRHRLGAHVISADFQGDDLVVWTAGNSPEAQEATTMVYVRFTGEAAPENAKHIASLSLGSGIPHQKIVFHLFV